MTALLLLLFLTGIEYDRGVEALAAGRYGAAFDAFQDEPDPVLRSRGLAELHMRAKDPVSVHDLHATMLHQLGIDHERLTYKFQGLDFKLTGVEEAHLVKEVLA